MPKLKINYGDIETKVKSISVLRFFHDFAFLNDNMSLRDTLARDQPIFILIDKKENNQLIQDKLEEFSSFYKPYLKNMYFIDLSNTENYDTVNRAFQYYLSQLKIFTIVQYTPDFDEKPYKDKISPVSNYYYFS